MAVADELITILGVDVARDAIAKLESFKNGVDSVKKTLLGLSVVITGAAATMGLMVKGAADEAMELQKLSEKTGISTDALQEWGYAAKKSGLDAKAITNDLTNLQKTMSSPIPGQFNQTMAMFGVSARDASGKLKTTDQVLLDMAGKFQSMNQQKAAQWASKLGISDDTLLLLRKGKDGIEELRKEAHKLGGIIPEESIKRAADFKRQLAELQFAFHGITSQVAIAMIPALSRVVDLFKAWIGQNKEWLQQKLAVLMEGIVNGFEKFWGVVKKVKDALKPLLDKLEPLTKHIKDNKKAVSDLVSGALLGLLVIFSPLLVKFALISAAILLASAAFNDLLVYMNGGDSTIGRIIERVKEFYKENEKLVKWLAYSIGTFIAFKAALAIESAFMVAKTAVVGLATGFRGLNAAMKANIFIALASMAVAAIQLIYENWDGIGEWFSKKWEAIKENFPDFGAWAESAKTAIMAKFSAAVEAVKKLLASMTDWLPDWVKDKIGVGSDGKSAPSTTSEAGKSAPSTIPVDGKPAQIPVAVGRGGAGTTQYNDNKQVSIHVATQNPEQAGQAAAAAISGQPPATPGSYATAQ